MYTLELSGRHDCECRKDMFGNGLYFEHLLPFRALLDVAVS